MVSRDDIGIHLGSELVVEGATWPGLVHTIEYPDALKPQAWAAAAPLLALRTLIGLDVVGERLRSRPLESKFGKLRLRNVTVRGSHVDAP